MPKAFVECRRCWECRGVSGALEVVLEAFHWQVLGRRSKRKLLQQLSAFRCATQQLKGTCN